MTANEPVHAASIKTIFDAQVAHLRSNRGGESRERIERLQRLESAISMASSLTRTSVLSSATASGSSTDYFRRTHRPSSAWPSGHDVSSPDPSGSERAKR